MSEAQIAVAVSVLILLIIIVGLSGPRDKRAGVIEKVSGTIRYNVKVRTMFGFLTVANFNSRQDVERYCEREGIVIRDMNGGFNET